MRAESAQLDHFAAFAVLFDHEAELHGGDHGAGVGSHEGYHNAPPGQAPQGELRGVSPPVVRVVGDTVPHRRAYAAPLAGYDTFEERYPDPTPHDAETDMWPEAPRTDEMLDQVRQGEAAAVDGLLAAHREAAAPHDRPAPRPRPRRPGRCQRRGAGCPARGPPPAQRLPPQPGDAVPALAAAHRQGPHHRRPPPPPRQAQRRSLDREQPLAPARSADQSSFDLAGQLLDQELTPASAAIRQRAATPPGSRSRRADEDDREIILMRHGEQLSNQETADALGVAEAAASMRYLRAVRRLRATLLPGGGAAVMSAAPSARFEATRDQRLADLLAELGEQARQGREPDVEAAAARYPDLAGELRELWAAVQIAERSRAARVPAARSARNVPNLPPRRLCRAPSATTSCWKRSAAAAWASSTRPGRRASTASSPSR